MDAVPAPRSGGIQSVERAVAALKVFGEDEPELGVTELARRLNLHKSTISRLMATLEAGGFVQQDPRTGRYRLGLQLATLAGRALNQYDLRDVARGALHSLARATGETCNLAVRDGDDAVNIDQALSTNPVKHLGWIGRRLPLHCSAAGKPLLAFAARTDIERVLALPLAAYTPRTVTDPEALLRMIGEAKKTGYAICVEEYSSGEISIAAAVLDYGRQPVAVDISRIDDVIHGRIRLGIMAYLSGAGSADFTTLKTRLQTTDGNLSVHLRKLEEAGFVAVSKSFNGRKPLTEASLTDQGRDAFVAYLDAMAGLLPER